MYGDRISRIGVWGHIYYTCSIGRLGKNCRGEGVPHMNKMYSCFIISVCETGLVCCLFIYLYWIHIQREILKVFYYSPIYLVLPGTSPCVMLCYEISAILDCHPLGLKTVIHTTCDASWSLLHDCTCDSVTLVSY